MTMTMTDAPTGIPATFGPDGAVRGDFREQPEIRAALKGAGFRWDRHAVAWTTRGDVSDAMLWAIDALPDLGVNLATPIGTVTATAAPAAPQAWTRPERKRAPRADRPQRTGRPADRARAELERATPPAVRRPRGIDLDNVRVPMERSYSGRGWVGVERASLGSHAHNLTVVNAHLRTDIKTAVDAGQLPAASYRVAKAARGNSITVTVDGPTNADVRRTLSAIAARYNCDDSMPETDYFSRGFHFNVNFTR